MLEVKILSCKFIFTFFIRVIEYILVVIFVLLHPFLLRNWKEWRLPTLWHKKKQTNKQKTLRPWYVFERYFLPTLDVYSLYSSTNINVLYLIWPTKTVSLFGCLALLRLLCIFENECGRRMTSLIYQIIPIFSSKN